MKTKFIQLLLVIVFAATFTSCVVPYRVREQNRYPRERHHHHHHDRHHGRH